MLVFFATIGGYYISQQTRKVKNNDPHYKTTSLLVADYLVSVQETGALMSDIWDKINKLKQDMDKVQKILGIQDDSREHWKIVLNGHHIEFPFSDYTKSLLSGEVIKSKVTVGDFEKYHDFALYLIPENEARDQVKRGQTHWHLKFDIFNFCTIPLSNATRNALAQSKNGKIDLRFFYHDAAEFFIQVFRK